MVTPLQSSEPQLTSTAPLAFLRTLIEEWRVVLLLPLFASILTVAVSFVVPYRYAAGATFVPEAENSRVVAGLAGLAGQLGLDMSGQAGSESPQFYADFALSRSMLAAVLLDTFAVHAGSGVRSARLIDLLEIGGATEPIRVNKGYKKLLKRVSVGVNRQTSAVRITVESPFPELSAALANRLVERINNFNVSQRRSRGGERRKFVQQRLLETQGELKEAEGRYRAFLEHNRRLATWATSRLENDALQRDVSTLRETLATLSHDLEESRIQEVNETAVITIVDPAVVPVERSWPKRGPLLITAIVLGLLLGIAIALGRRYRATLKTHNRTEYQALADAWQDFTDQVRRHRRPA